MDPRKVFGSDKCQVLGKRNIYRLHYVKMNLIRIVKEYQVHLMELKFITLKIGRIGRDKLPSLERSATSLLTYVEVMFILVILI